MEIDHLKEDAYLFATHHNYRIQNHYHKARTKHRELFCDRLTDADDPVDSNLTYEPALTLRRAWIAADEKNGRLSAEGLLDCELLEASVEIANGDKVKSVDELYDAVAIILRAIDVIEGRQHLGRKE